MRTGGRRRRGSEDERPGGTYHVSMTSFRMLVTVLAVMHALFAGFTALVGAFANGGDVWQRLLVVLLHPLGAAGVCWCSCCGLASPRRRSSPSWHS